MHVTIPSSLRRAQPIELANGLTPYPSGQSKDKPCTELLATRAHWQLRERASATNTPPPALEPVSNADVRLLPQASITNNNSLYDKEHHAERNSKTILQ